MVVSPGFRMFALVIGAICVGGFFWLINRDTTKTNAVSYVAQPKISQTELVFSDVALSPSYGAYYKISGKVKNNSQSATFSEADIKITIFDCPRPDSMANCETIGQTTTSVRAETPPGQTRAFENGYVDFKNKPQPRFFRWNYEIGQLLAK